MKERIKRIVFLLLFLLVFISFLSNVKADILYDGSLENGEMVCGLYVKGMGSISIEGECVLQMTNGYFKDEKHSNRIYLQGTKNIRVEIIKKPFYFKFRNPFKTSFELVLNYSNSSGNYFIKFENTKINILESVENVVAVYDSSKNQVKISQQDGNGKVIDSSLENVPECAEIVLSKTKIFLFANQCEANPDNRFLIGNINGKINQDMYIILRECVIGSSKVYFENGLIKFTGEQTSALFCNGIYRRLTLDGSLYLNTTKINGEEMFIMYGEKEIKNDFIYKQKGAVAYGITSDNVKILDGSIAIEDIEIKGKNINVVHEKSLLGSRENSIYIEPYGARASISKGTNVEITLQGIPIQFENGEIKGNKIILPRKVLSSAINDEKGNILAECKESICSFKKEGKTGKIETLDISFVPYLMRPLQEKARDFYTNEAIRFIPSEQDIEEIKGAYWGYFTPDTPKIIMDRARMRTGEGTERTYMHEAGHAIWFEGGNKLKIDKKQFAADINEYLYNAHLTGEYAEIRDYIKEELLRSYHKPSNSNLVGILRNIILAKNKGENKGENFELIANTIQGKPYSNVDTEEAWSWIIEEIYKACKKNEKPAIPQYILEHYKGVVNENCL